MEGGGLCQEEREGGGWEGVINEIIMLRAIEKKSNQGMPAVPHLHNFGNHCTLSSNHIVKDGY